MESNHDTTRLHAFVSGHVQGVGFRWWVSDRGRELGLDGYAKNLPDGRVEVLAQGPRQACEALLRMLAEQPSSRRRPGWVDAVTRDWLPPAALPSGFTEY